MYSILDYATDKVPNIRIRLAKLLLKIRYMLNYDDPNLEE